MASLPVMLFLMTLLLPSMLTQGMTQKEPTISADHQTIHNAALEKTEHQGEGNSAEALEKMLSASHQDQMSFEDLQHKLNVSKLFAALIKSAQNHQVVPVNVSDELVSVKLPKLIKVKEENTKQRKKKLASTDFS